MKFNIHGKKTKGATRVLQTFTETLFNLLLKKPFDEISVNELCEVSGYPRATFYNYFDDKYDLLDYCWFKLTETVRIKNISEIPSNYVFEKFFNRVYTLCARYETQMKRIFKNNMPESYFISSFRIYMTEQMKKILDYVKLNTYKPVTDDLMAEYYCNTLLLVLEWRFIRDRLKTREQTKNVVSYLIWKT